MRKFRPKNNFTTKMAALGYKEITYSLYVGKNYHVRLRTLKFENKNRRRYFIVKGNDVIYIATNQEDLLTQLKEI